MKRSIRAARSIAVTAGVVAAAALGTAREHVRLIAAAREI